MLIWSCALALVLLGVARTHADILVLMDGRQFKGEVVEETSSYVVFRHDIAGFWSNVKYTRAQIDGLYPEEGDQSDLSDAPVEEEKPHTPNKPETSHLPKVVVIPLHGAVGSAGEDPILDTFDAVMLTERFEDALELEAQAVILDIKSPGGLVSEMEAICETILRYSRSLRIVAYPRDAFSAAAIISLCCKEMIVHPDARVGAAVIIQTSTAGVSAVDAKMASPHHAKQKQFMEKSGRPYELVAAMTIQETELWWHAEHGFATDAPPRNARDGWKQLDGKSTILTMTANEAVEWGLAKGSARSTIEIITRLGITGEISIVDMTEDVERYTATMQRRFDDLLAQISIYFRALRSLRDAIVDLGDAYENKDRTAARKHKSIISRQITRMQTSGRAIQKIDKSLLARRIQLPDAALEQMQADASLLGRISGLIKTDTYDGFNESVDRLNTVLEAWRALLY